MNAAISEPYPEQRRPRRELLRLERVEVRLGGTPVIQDVEFTLAPGSFTAIVGPNGSGKSTVLGAAARAHRPSSGAVFLGDQDAWRLSAKAAARRCGVLPQQQSPGMGFTGREVVSMGRMPYLRPLAGMSTRDHELVDQALVDTGAESFANRLFAELSGGERQRVLLARALCQDADLLILDEPTNHLDIAAQLELLDLVRSLLGTADSTAVSGRYAGAADGSVPAAPRRAALVALHQLDHALDYADRIVMMNQGAVHAIGSPTEVFTERNMREVFGVHSALGVNPLTGRPSLHCAPLETTLPGHDRAMAPEVAND
ncbi:ABC transporter ATP-binding protein [Acaricomes phytoseiuli]|uniref:ABC transporter ATP-binding protein n=1 Tax=Acaricomes phytoseiuli TaxID=291968 RepID=UPI000373B1E3|nr:ABC transporter ATP-binding protein [Acaricomes phytoseiuli]MCW1248610.1 ABC transporter ATP-binding protein [Acaricomes phytoseiuli]